MAFPLPPYTDGQTHTEDGVDYIYDEGSGVWLVVTPESSGGGGGGTVNVDASMIAPSYAITATIRTTGSLVLSSNQQNIVSGPSKKAGCQSRFYPEASAQLPNGFVAPTGFVLAGPDPWTPNGGIEVVNAGKYRFRWRCETTLAAPSEVTMQEQASHQLLINDIIAVEDLCSREYFMYKVSMNWSSQDYRGRMITNSEGIINIPANGILSLAIRPGSLSTNPGTFYNYQNLHLESLF